MRAGTNGGFQLNLWMPDPPPKRDSASEDAIRRFLGKWGPEVPAEAGDVKPPNFEAQCEAATVTTVSEAKAAESAGADIIVAQGMEAGGHRGAFDATQAETRMVGLFSLLPTVVDAVKLPVIAAEGVPKTISKIS